MPTRRAFLAAVVTGTAATLLWKPTGTFAAPLTVEIVALPHWPVQNALKPVRAYLMTLGERVHVVDLDAESDAGEQRLGALGLKGHIPILLVINGSYRFKRKDGSAVAFKDFPAKSSNPAGLNGAWSEADFEDVVEAQLAKLG